MVTVCVCDDVCASVRDGVCACVGARGLSPLGLMLRHNSHIKHSCSSCIYVNTYTRYIYEYIYIYTHRDESGVRAGRMHVRRFRLLESCRVTRLIRKPAIRERNGSITDRRPPNVAQNGIG